MRGILAGALALIALEVLVSNRTAAGAVGGVFDLVARAARGFLSPDVPAIPDRSSSSSSSTVAPSSTAVLSQPPKGVSA
jgi:hypothetical protein